MGLLLWSFVLMSFSLFFIYASLFSVILCDIEANNIEFVLDGIQINYNGNDVTDCFRNNIFPITSTSDCQVLGNSTETSLPEDTETGSSGLGQEVVIGTVVGAVFLCLLVVIVLIVILFTFPFFNKEEEVEMNVLENEDQEDKISL